MRFMVAEYPLELPTLYFHLLLILENLKQSKLISISLDGTFKSISIVVLLWYLFKRSQNLQYPYHRLHPYH